MIDSEKPKYQMLREYLIQMITTRELSVGDRIFSENELADKFKISRHTVRQAIGEMVNDGWLYRVQGKGTYVNRHPGDKAITSKTIGVITTYLSDYIFPSIIRGIDNVLSLNNYNIVLACTYNQHEKERLCLLNLLTQNIGGLIVEPTKSALPNPNIDLYKEFSSRNIPVLFIHGCYKELNYSYVVEDDYEAGCTATKHLLELGHRKIAGIFKVDDIQGHYRFSGFQRAHHEAGLIVPDSRILWFETEEPDIKFKSGGSQIEKLISQCSAIVCYNDDIALKVMDVIRGMKLSIPNDISIISFDDSQFAVASEVKLTTVAHPKEKLGEEAAMAIINMISRKQDYYDVKITPELVVRGSTIKYTGENENEI
jgi:GntR family transcriptional regulator of arabinose operon